MSRTVTWTAPYPEALAEIVGEFKFRPGWRAQLAEGTRDDGCGQVTGLALILTAETVNSYDHSRRVEIEFVFTVPPEVHTPEGWRWWLWQRVGDAEAHERGEFFAIGDEHPFAPGHQPSADGYGPRWTATL